jgi:hypothetical protein
MEEIRQGLEWVANNWPAIFVYGAAVLTVPMGAIAAGAVVYAIKGGSKLRRENKKFFAELEEECNKDLEISKKLNIEYNDLLILKDTLEIEKEHEDEGRLDLMGDVRRAYTDENGELNTGPYRRCSHVQYAIQTHFEDL